MHQVFKATDSADQTVSYFYFDNEGGETVHELIDDMSDSEVIEEFKRRGCDWDEEPETRSRMINPVLIAEWEE